MVWKISLKILILDQEKLILDNPLCLWYSGFTIRISMEIATLEPVVRMMVREVAIGMNDEDISIQHPEYAPHQIAKIRTGATFKRAVKEMQAKIDEELVQHAAQDPVKQFLHGKGLSMARTLVSLAENHDGETPHAVMAKAASSVLDRAGYGSPKESVVVPILMLSPDKLSAVMEAQKATGVVEIPDYVDGHTSKVVT
jgi:hypothetical protein